MISKKYAIISAIPDQYDIRKWSEPIAKNAIIHDNGSLISEHTAVSDIFFAHCVISLWHQHIGEIGLFENNNHKIEINEWIKTAPKACWLVRFYDSINFFHDFSSDIQSHSMRNKTVLKFHTPYFVVHFLQILPKACQMSIEHIKFRIVFGQYICFLNSFKRKT